MRSSDFGSIVSPLGTAPAMAQAHPSRQPSGGLTALGPKVTPPAIKGRVITKQAGAQPRMHHQRLTAMAGVTSRGMPKMAPAKPFADGGEVDAPEVDFNQYLGSGAAPQGLSPEQYQADYGSYLDELEAARKPMTGNPLRFKDPVKVAAIRDANTKNLALTLGGGAWGSLPWIAPEAGLALAGGDLVKSLGVDSMPGMEDYVNLPKHIGVPTDDPHFQLGAHVVDAGLGALSAPGAIKEGYKVTARTLKTLRTKLSAMMAQKAADARDALEAARRNRTP